MTSPAPININLLRHARPYETALFVNRSSELQVVSERVRQAQARSVVTEPIVNFWGVRGIGKTWTLRHLHHRYAFQPEDEISLLGEDRPTFALFYAFPIGDETSFQAQLTIVLAEQALVQLASALSIEERALLTQARDTRNVEPLIKALLTLAPRFVPLLLLDEGENLSQDAWEQLERDVIEPIVSAGQAIVVVAGRRQVIRWRRFEVRRRVMGPEKSQLTPFDKETVDSQIQRSDYQIPVDLLFPYTAGNPHLVNAIAQHIVSWSGGTEQIGLDKGWFDQHQNDLLHILRASEAQLLEHVPPKLLAVLDAVSPLRFYRLEALRLMLNNPTDQGSQKPDGYYLSILRTLDQQTDLVWWDRDRRAYVTSQVIRQLVGRRQLLESRAAYMERHRRALDMYWEWVHTYPETSEDFVVEIWFHLASIYLANADLKELHTQAIKVLEFVNPYLNLDHFLILPEQLRTDRELRDLLPLDLYAALTRELEQLISSKAQHPR
jgi:hypothetical protein